MPYKPRPECRYLGCNKRAIKGSGFCKEHQAMLNIRPSSVERGYNYKWNKYRKEYLKRHPYCAICHTRIATVVDHIIPHRGNKDLFWDKNNHQALCIYCHNRKTANGK